MVLTLVVSAILLAIVALRIEISAIIQPTCFRRFRLQT